MDSRVFEAIVVGLVMLIMFSQLILMLWRDKPNQFIRVHYPDAYNRDLPKTFQDIDRKRRASKF